MTYLPRSAPRFVALTSFWVLSLSACSDPRVVADPEEPAPDAGPGGSIEAGVVDAGSPFDGGGPPDAGGGPDAFLTDAGTPDSDAGAPGTDAASPAGPVSITLAFGGDLAEGLDVIFQNADHSLVASCRTDATGTATAVMAPGGSVTAIYATPSLTSLYTYLEVAPGDQLRVGTSDASPSSVSVTLPDLGRPDVRYVVQSPCGGVLGEAPRLAMRVLPGCPQGDVFVGAWQRRAPYGDFGAFLVEGVDLASGPVDLSAQTFAPSTAVRLELTNTPETTFSIISKLAVTTPTVGRWLTAGSGVSVLNYRGSPTATAMGEVPTVGASTLLVDTTVLRRDTMGTVGAMQVIERVPFTTRYPLDWSSAAVPVVTRNASLDTDGRIEWGEGSSGTADWVRGYFRSRRGALVIDRSVRGPHRGPEIQLPPLPAGFQELEPRADDEIETRFFFVGRSPGGWRAYRQRPTDDDRDLLITDGDRFSKSWAL